jgi:hypothetical protein
MTMEKLEQIVDKLLVKTQDNLCEWKKITPYKFQLKTLVADIIIGAKGGETIYLDVMRNDIEIASISSDKKENSLVRLFGYVKSYQEKQTNEYLDKIMSELQKLGEQPF